MKKLPKVSIIIPAYNEEETLGKLLDSLMKLNYPKKKLEVIVVDDGSTDRTGEIVKKFKRVKLIKGRHKGVGAARNLGWKKSKNDIILFLDADMKVTTNYVKEIIKPLDKPRVAGCDHEEKLLNKKSLISRLLYLRKVPGWKRNPLVLRSVKKEILKEVKGIDSEYGYFDDQVLGIKILERGYIIVRSKKAKVWHREPESLKDLWRQSRWIGKSIIFSFKGYKKMALKRILFPLLCASLPIYLIFLFLAFPFWFLGIVGLILFLIIEIQRSVKTYQMTKWKESFLTPFFDFVSMFMICIGIVIGLISKGKPKI